MVIWLVPIAVMVLTALAEWAHARRSRRLAYLAFGPEAKPRAWVAAAGPLRIAAMGAVCFGLLVLWKIDPTSAADRATADQPPRHFIIALDVSPSMGIVDAGPAGGVSRAQRARELLKSVMDRVDMTHVRVSIIAFYTEARPVVIDTFDPEVVNNVLNDLPLEHAFAHGKTAMYDGVRLASEISKAWSPGSAVLLVVADGDTLPDKGLPTMSPAIAEVLVIGVGNTHRGTYIDGHSSRQDSTALNRLALQLSGAYHDGNAKHVPTAQLEAMSESLPLKESGAMGLRGWALWALGGGASVLAMLSPALALAGTRWQPASVRRRTPNLEPRPRPEALVTGH